MTIGKTLKRFRKEFHLSQSEVARKAGILQQSYSACESESKPTTPKVDMLIKIAKAFNVSIDYLVGLSNNPEINTAPCSRSVEIIPTDGNEKSEFETQVSVEIENLKKRLNKLESRFNF